MMPNCAAWFLLAGCIFGGMARDCLAQAEATLPSPVKAVWSLDKAWRQKSDTRERVCLNGLWRWQPASSGDTAKAAPAEGWGWFKVPGCWPGVSDYMQKDCQTVFPHPSWKAVKLEDLTAAWYQREITVPADWAGRRIGLSAEYLNSYALIYVDGAKAGEMRFPAGEVDLTAVCRAGSRHALSLLVVAMPLKGVMLSYSDSAAAKEVEGSVERRGLCGDVYLLTEPAGPRIRDVRVETSTRKGEIALAVALEDLAAEGHYVLRARVGDAGGTATQFASPAFRASDLKDGRYRFVQPWKPGKLWDLHTPGNLCQLDLSLAESAGGGKVLDAALPIKFGFREFWIDGRDFYLNGSRIFLSSVPLDNAQVSAGLASYEAARETMLRLKSFGINMVYTHNYDCEPGSHLSFAEILQAADDVGMLVSFSQPHFGQYEWEANPGGGDPGASNGYAQHAAFYVQAAGNHPSVVMYSMSHNATGYGEDMNPDMLDGLKEPRDQWALGNAKLALRAQAIVNRLDPTRIVYHHSSGNLGSMHPVNFYANFIPIQEMSDWFEHWATAGVKPAFTCEYGVPFTWDWTLYRGWYKGEREFGSAEVPWELCLAEWNAQFLGDRAYRISEAEKVDLRWEALRFREGKLWHRWDYPLEVSAKVFDDRYEVLAMYLADNWRAMRTWGLSANSPWEHGNFWRLRDGVDKKRRELKTDWENLQRPGFSADYIDDRYETMDLAFERSDWVPTAAAAALIRNNQPLLAYIGGGPERFTTRDHNFLPGQAVEKQLIVLNNSREPVTCDCEWSLALPAPVTGVARVTVATGRQERISLRFELPTTLAAGSYQLTATAKFSGGESQRDSFDVHVLQLPATSKLSGPVAVYDPKGETSRWLEGLGIKGQPVDVGAKLADYDLLIIGKDALTVDGPAPDLSPVRDGLKVLVFEQTSTVLEKRLGFRVQEYGLRQVFPRVADHPALDGIAVEHLGNWRGAATILAPRLTYQMRPRYGPTVQWCGIDVTRAWRCGNWGSVASVLIEKPARGDFLPIVDGGFSLQYSPLLEYRQGKGVVLFCQLDVTGRTEADPAADRLARNILQYVQSWKPGPSRRLVYVGEAAGRDFLIAAGFTVEPFADSKLSGDDVLVVGPGGGRQLANRRAVGIGEWLRAGLAPGHMLLIGLDESEANAILPFKVTMKKAEHIAAFFEAPPKNSALAGVGSADVHNRDPRELPLVTGGAVVVGDGVLATAQSDHVVFCQLVPWQFDPGRSHNVKQTYRRASFLVVRLLANMGVGGVTPILDRFKSPVNPRQVESRWLEGLYLDRPEEWDDPYRFFRW